MNTYKALLFDTKSDSTETLKKMIATFCPYVEVIGVAENIYEAIIQIEAKNQILSFSISVQPRRKFFLLLKE